MAKEKRLIDAGELIKHIEKTLNNAKGSTNWDFGRQGGILSARGLIEAAPTVDAVEVVRCQECRYFDPKADGTVGFCKCGEVCGYCHSMRVADDFCSYGERRDKDAVD